MTLTFEDDATFAYAQRVWDWVNGADNHTFLMVAGKGDCGDNPHRVPYLVSSIKYDEKKNIAHLTAETGEWKDLAHSYELHVGSVPMTDDFRLRKRDYTKDASIDLSADFGWKTKVKTGNVFVEVVCDPCGTVGKVNFEFIIKTKLKIPTGLEFRMSPQGLKAQAGLYLNTATNFGVKTNIKKRWDIAKIPLAGVSIPGGILTVGPVLVAAFGVEATGLETGISLRTGATAAIPDSAIVQADLLSPSNNKFSGWIPEITTDDLTIQARISFYAKLFLQPALELQVEALGHGVSTGLDLKTPFWEGRITGVDGKS